VARPTAENPRGEGVPELVDERREVPDDPVDRRQPDRGSAEHGKGNDVASRPPVVRQVRLHHFDETVRELASGEHVPEHDQYHERHQPHGRKPRSQLGMARWDDDP